LILLDLFMPDPDGFAVLESLRAEQSEVYLAIIVLTADVNEETKRRALHCGATDFLNKPLDYIEVLLRIRNLLETRRIHCSITGAPLWKTQCTRALQNFTPPKLHWRKSRARSAAEKDVATKHQSSARKLRLGGWAAPSGDLQNICAFAAILEH